ncbi:glycosyltransferase family 4 protein [Mycobacterium sp. 852014-52144_SCH5372336]|uniref:glycosyltransferase family 4 protein n=1 Tax=Mycobacterium sp. 852014-52144_SCH5372336 TaxID=1834115 RepID=UPI0007FDBE91|nr:glycosyltransferase family 4 protein [Mycobacterium sp. 852014-52144_SCH5372336]OBB73350.1 hypothetical protein A5759_15715 [Mycobacterium sp. 852014-52144_SCH5372336]
MDNPISVNFVGLNYFPEPFGIAPYATGLCRALAERGHRVNVITGMPHYPEWRIQPPYRRKWAMTETVDGMPVRRVRHSVPKSVSNSRRLLMETTFGLRAACSGWGTPDVVICTSPALVATAAVCMRNRASARRPAIGVWVQDLYSVGLNETQKSSFAAEAASRLESWVLRTADGVIVPHDRFRVQLVEKLGVEPAKVETIRNWTHVRSTDGDDGPAERARFGWSDNEIVVLHAGSMGVKQGLENVVRAAQIAAERNLNLRFVLAGDGNQRHVLEEMSLQTTHLDIRDPFPDSDFRAALRSADVLLLNERPGVAEMSIPSKLTSYFQSGTPVLAATSPLSNAAGEIKNARAGIVIDSGEPALLVDAAVALGSDAPLRRRLGDNGIRYAAEELREDAALNRFEEWIRRLAGRPTSLTADLQRGRI